MKEGITPEGSQKKASPGNPKLARSQKNEDD